MKKLNLKIKKNQKTHSFGMSLAPSLELYIKRRLDELREKCPSTANLKLNLEKRKSCIEGSLKVNSFSKNFFSEKVANNPLQTYLLLEEDIEAQLLEWKRNRFSNFLFNQLTKTVKPKEDCA